jgi:GNAT superfamily N-acetyltransferase
MTLDSLHHSYKKGHGIIHLIINESAVVYLTTAPYKHPFLPDGRLISNIMVHPRYRGLGWGSIILRHACQMADMAQTPLYVFVQPLISDPEEVFEVLTREMLDQWYRRHGFEGEFGHVLHRLPRTPTDPAG